jgi:hypothetical protein
MASGHAAAAADVPAEEEAPTMTEAEYDAVAFPQGFDERQLLPAGRDGAAEDDAMSDAVAAGLFKRCIPTTDYDAQLKRLGL